MEPCLALHNSSSVTVVVRSGRNAIAHDVARLRVCVGPPDGTGLARGRGKPSVVRSLRTLATRYLPFLVDKTAGRARITIGGILQSREISLFAICAGRIGIGIAGSVLALHARGAGRLPSASLVCTTGATVTSDLLCVSRKISLGAIRASRVGTGVSSPVLA